MKKPIILLLTTCICLQVFTAGAQNNYFIDGYHGGIWGHYPAGYTGFISEMLEKNPFWKINVEIEPETWDNARLTDQAGYTRFLQLAKDQSATGRVEFVNPAYGQSYLFNIQGESVIRQMELGIKKIREHFPEAAFITYSSEEPCFTSALPQILKSFGYKYASLKNPNTCWGGYTTAYGGELVNWTGPDGSKLLSVPRYETEHLLQGSTWQTIAWNNSKDYLDGARSQGIQNPIGMCLQDAGWKNGPWLGQPKGFEYQTWRNYIGSIANKQQVNDWKFTQENVQVSLVWGSQILQKLAQNVRKAENKLIMAEKINAIHSVFFKKQGKRNQFITAWQNLLLAQHHDSWIVPYNIVNRAKKLNWADQVRIWTNKAGNIADSVLNNNGIKTGAAQSGKFNVCNTVAAYRFEVMPVKLTGQFSDPVVCDISGTERITQESTDADGNRCLLFRANGVPLGLTVYQIRERKKQVTAKPMALVSKSQGKYRIQTSLYNLVLNPAKGGILESLVAKGLGSKEFAGKSKAHFNEMKGYFYSDSAWISSADHPASIEIIENGPLRMKLKIKGHIGTHPFTQWITLNDGDEKIDFQTHIDWQGNPGIGQDYNQTGKWKAEQIKKAFYNDQYKLSALFPLNLKKQKLYKNAAFDVMESKLTNTYFNTWDSIKNNIIVNWVDVSQHDDELGMALLTDHTTSYSHGEDGVLGLTMQYSGMGLWGRNYSINGPTEIKYALIPHAKKWDKADLWSKSLKWNEPMQVLGNSENVTGNLFNLSSPGYEISSIQTDGKILTVRIFNASGHAGTVYLIPGIKGDAPATATMVELNGNETASLSLEKGPVNQQGFKMEIPAFGIRTIKLQLN